MPMYLPDAPYTKFTHEQLQRIEAAANKLAPSQRSAFRERVKKAVRVPMGRGKVTDPNVGVAISIALREFSRQPR
jgi:hypothetical protein